jgi:molybdopterin-containing oxidoreductase family iron-sulfur binding subunit
MSRLYSVENQLSVTGSIADNRLPIHASAIQSFAIALTEAVLNKSSATGAHAAWINAVAEDLRKHEGKSLVVAGPRQPALVHALAAQMNASLKNTKTVVWRERAGTKGKSLKDLVDAIDKKQVETLIILGGNPVYTAPADFHFGEKLKKVKHSAHLSLYADETSVKCDWHLPMSHFLESWGDCEAFDGSYSPIQPLIAPLHFESGTQTPKTRSALELLSRLSPKARGAEAYKLVLESFRKRVGDKGDEKAFRQVLHGGYLPSSARKPVDVKINEADIATAVKKAPKREAGMELSIHGDYRVLDGRFTNNGWLIETPDPVSKLTWDNAALVSPETAKDLGIETGSMVTITVGRRELTLPVFVQPGQANQSISIHLGYGHSETGRISKKSGFNAYELRTSDALWFTIGIEVKATGEKYRLASTQNHGNITEGSKLKSEAKRVDEIARARTMDQFAEDLKEKKHESHALPLITNPALDGQYQWGMVIDLSKCVGCNACQVACQAENNVPIVGKGEILRGREMFWIRIDRYYTGKEDNPQVIHQPVACVHCEVAPCETVCPVNAAVHSPEGLNLQVYNRCIGTRYCANNCPYKVRRFNWFDFQQRPLDELRLGPLAPKGKPETLKMQMNPDVTVRMRGVMEKCTYCVQRIERGKIGAKVAHPRDAKHPIADGTITPACAQACPAEAIVFGDLKDNASRVKKLKSNERHYVLLESVGTKPRTTYLLRLRNPNPKLA